MSRYRISTDKPKSRVKKYREGGPVGEPAGDRIMLDEVDVVAPKFQPKGLFKGIRERFARNIYPVGYGGKKGKSPMDRVLDAVVRDIPETKNIYSNIWPDQHISERKALLDLSMGIPVREEAIGALSVSDYKPTKSTDNNTTYLRSKATEDEIVSGYLFDPEELQWLNNSLRANDGKLKTYGGTLGNYTISLGEDEDGTYLAYYDLWDLNPADDIPGIREVVDSATAAAGVNPPEIYGRVYVDVDEEGNIIGYRERQPKERPYESKRYRNETKEN